MGNIDNRPFISVAESRNGRTPLAITCVECGSAHHFNVPSESIERWDRGTFIQDAFPELSNGDREMFISGVCSECFNRMFPDDEDDG